MQSTAARLTLRVHESVLFTAMLRAIVDVLPRDEWQTAVLVLQEVIAEHFPTAPKPC